MALAEGSVTVDESDLTHTGSGMSLDIYLAFKTRIVAKSFWSSLTTGEKGKLLTSNGEFAEDIATAIIPYLKTNGDVRITTGDSGLQEVSGAPTDAPTSDVVLSGAIE